MNNVEAHSSILVLSGAGLSAASGVPTFRDKDGLWEGYEITQVATPSAWFADRKLVRRFYSERRLACAQVKPNEGHYALARLQDAMGTDQVTLVTQNIDGLLQKAGCQEVIEMHGSLWRLRCEDNPHHPTVSFEGAQDGSESCGHCGAALRPDVVWFGETLPVEAVTLAQSASESCDVFLLVGTSAVVYPAAGLPLLASDRGAYVVEVNTEETGLTGAVDESLLGRSGQVLPDLASLMASTR